MVEQNQENINRGEPDIGNVVIRRDVLTLTQKQIGQVRNLEIRAQLEELLYEARQQFPDKKDLDRHFPGMIAEWSAKTKTRRVRTLKPAENIVPIRYRADGSRYKYVIPGQNHHMDIVESPDGKWHGVAQSLFEATHDKQDEKKGKTIIPKWRNEFPDARFIMRLHKGDTMQLFDKDGVNRIMRVVRISPSANLFNLAEHLETGNLQSRHDDKEDHFRWDFANIGKLKDRRARRVRIDPIGRVRTMPHGAI